MNKKENYTVNDDGSVTFTGSNDAHAETIADIFRVEFAKGGIFAGLRMYNRAVKYAKKAGIANSRLLVEKLMLEEYPTRFKTVKPARRLMWYVIAGAFFVIPAIWALIVQGNRIKKRGRLTTLELPGSWHTCIFNHRCSCMSIAL